MNEKNETEVQTIENATRDDVRPGDHVTWEDTWERRSVTRTVRREGIAAYQRHSGDWDTADGMNITSGEGDGITITIRRTIRQLPTAPTTIIVANDGHDAVEAVFGGMVWRASEAVLGGDGRWHGVWRKGRDRVAVSSVYAGSITPDTWKVENPAPAPPAEEVELPTEFGDVILNPRWGARSYTRAVHLGEGVWAAEVTPGAEVYTHLARDLRSATLPDGARARRAGDHGDGTPRFVKAREGEK